nr:putative reverse transcriptase domain-containing protein [Tanacetum cinerariifolium]
MPPKSMSKVRMREIICDQFATSMNEFMSNMNNGAGGSGGASSSGEAGGSGGTGRNADGTGVRDARPTVHELTGCTYATFIKCNPLPFNGTKGAVGLCQWFEKLESAFQISECKEKDRVKFAMATLRGNNRGGAYQLGAVNAQEDPKVVTAQVIGTVSKEKRVEDVPVIRDFLEVFPEDLPGLPPPRQVEFRIDLILGATPVAREPYRLAPSELKELSEKLKELSE